MDWIPLIRIVHTAICLFASACIACVVHCGITGRSGRRTWASMGIVYAIGVVYVANGFQCPITTFVRRSTGRTDVPDILFPDWFSRWIVPVSTALFLFGMILVAYRLLRAWNSR